LLKLQQALRFGFVGAINTVVDVLFFYVFARFLNIEPVIANILSYSLGMLCSFSSIAIRCH